MGYFGTDGVRGIANSELTCDLAFALGQAAVAVLGKRLVIGRDTRRSGIMLESALTAGITSVGGEALLAGIVPTPAVAFLTRTLAADGGVVISASHNAPEYNGIKFFDAEGLKLSRTLEIAFEQLLARATADDKGDGLPTGSAIGSAERIRNPGARYVTYAVNCLRRQHLDFSGLKVALDCAHGASWQTSPDALRRLGADVAAINTTFNGDDINVRSGSTHLEPLIKLVAKTEADVGFAHDGDADRVLAVSATGAVVDGDKILAILARDFSEQGLLAGGTVVSTVMANLGFTRAMESLGITVKQTDVGDSNVLAEMLDGNSVLGGEQSGHIIISEYNSTGDGLLTALMLLAVMRRTGKSLDELARVMTSYPQVLVNVKNVEKDKLESVTSLKQSVALVESELETLGGGRVLLRASGTEPVVRVMVEAVTEQLAQSSADKLAAQVFELLKMQH